MAFPTLTVSARCNFGITTLTGRQPRICGVMGRGRSFLGGNLRSDAFDLTTWPTSPKRIRSLRSRTQRSAPSAGETLEGRLSLSCRGKPNKAAVSSRFTGKVYRRKRRWLPRPRSGMTWRRRSSSLRLDRRGPRRLRQYLGFALNVAKQRR